MGDLPSWNEGRAKQAIVDFVGCVTTTGPDYVSENERVAVFDNDGTLWCEMPVPVQAFFANDRLRALAPKHPEWKTTEPFKSQLAGDMKGVMATGLKDIAELTMATHAGMTTDEFVEIVRDWLFSAKHPKLNRAYTSVIYQPMLEVLEYLRAQQFSTFIVSGGGVEFMRVFAEDVYGIPPQQIVGSTIKTHFEFDDGKPVLVRDPALDFFDDKAGKPVAINKYIGRRPIACFGNSDGDREMLMWTTLGRPDGLPSFGLIVHHTDAEREFAYDRQHVLSGQLDKGLDEAEKYGWVLADMKKDWKTVFPATAKTANQS
ncbi:MAG: haloacid dehalogenase-like hydrolase [Pyrinomonadaceae bacterium]|nr:haloacid dehalogenase-like hydrolase [Pyrinomonadaceae bacterium]